MGDMGGMDGMGSGGGISQDLAEDMSEDINMTTGIPSESEMASEISADGMACEMSSATSEEEEDSMNIYLNEEQVIENDTEDQFTGYSFGGNNYGYGNTVNFEYPKLQPVNLNSDDIDLDLASSGDDDSVGMRSRFRRRLAADNEDELRLDGRLRRRLAGDDTEGEEVFRRGTATSSYYNPASSRSSRYDNTDTTGNTGDMSNHYNTNSATSEMSSYYSLSDNSARSAGAGIGAGSYYNRDNSDETTGPFPKMYPSYPSRITFPFKNNNNNNYSESSLSSPSTPEPIFGKLSREEGGKVGLRNLGNTCYLNSTLQCLTATGELSFKLAEEFESGQLDKSNKSSEKGKMFLNSIGRLFHEMWQSAGKMTSINRLVEPRQFKSVLGMIDSRFSGYRQEDSQEALAIILDRLHEDLKTSDPADGDGDSNGDGDGWEKYCGKENSIVRKLFHGQLKSTVKCKTCSFKSETFDPFCFLNLPIPLEPDHDIIVETVDAVDADNSVSTVLPPTATVSAISKIAPQSRINVLCYNDKVYNRTSSYLIINRHFSGLNEFRSFFRGSSYWLIEFEPAKLPLSVRTKLPEIKAKNSTFIAYRADLLKTSYLISFEAERTGEIVGFPVMIRRPHGEEELTPALFIKGFLNDSIRPILLHRFPDRLEQFDSSVSLMLASPNEYFKIEPIGTDFDLIKIKVIILNDKSDFNETIFFRDVDDPNDLFEELVYESEAESEEEEEEEEEEDGEIVDSMTDTVDDSTALYPEIPPYNSHMKSYNPYSHPYPYPHSSESSASSSSRPFIPTLKDCFHRLCSRETLDWKCEKCGELVQAEKGLQLWRLPDILVLHLKRFSYGMMGATGSSSYYMMSSSIGGGGGAKIGRAVDFALEIDLKDVMGDSSPAQSTRFELFAISQHFGSLHYGHYTAILKHQESSKWFLADDSNIKVFDDDMENSWFTDSVKEAAYVLFYRRKK